MGSCSWATPRGPPLFAIDTGDRPRPAQGRDQRRATWTAKVAALLGTDAEAGHDQRPGGQPRLRQGLPVGLARPRARTPSPVILRVGPAAKLEEVSLEDVPFAKAELPNAPDAAAQDARAEPLRNESITDLAYVDGRRLRRRAVERGVLVPAARDPLPVHRLGRRRRGRDLPRLPRPVRDQVAGADLRGLPRSRASPTCWPPTPARRWSRCPSPTSRPAPRQGDDHRRAGQPQPAA